MNIVQTSTISTGNYEPGKTRLNLPKTEQTKLNTSLNEIADKYREDHPELSKSLRQNTCSEPLPCAVYCLPKDHKEGDLKGRPIHAATDTPATRLSKFLAKSLNTLLAHVPAHLRNTEEFIEFLSSMDDSIKGFCSLDVCNLYGSIPLEDQEDGTPGLFSVIREFFSNFKHNSCLQHLTDMDFETLIRLCLTSDTILIQGSGYTQKTGLAMGNNLAPTMAIIYMNKLDEGILTAFEEPLYLKRYIDDMFVAWSTNDIDPTRLLEIANELNTSIEFTIELPKNNQLPFLDTMVTLNPEEGKFNTSLYIKPIHSQCVTPWDSHNPISQKRGLLIGETKRAISRSTNSYSRTKSLRLIKQIFRRNGYPKSFVQKTINKATKTHHPTESDEKVIHLKVPFINEEYKRRTQAVIHRTGIDNIKIHYINGRRSARIFAPPKERQECSPNCITCSNAEKENCCLLKHCVYQITCMHCNALYIGETGRTIGSRIKEHVNTQQTVYIHMTKHTSEPTFKDLKWKIIHTNLHYVRERKIIEAMEIKNTTGTLMNGCVGRYLNI